MNNEADGISDVELSLTMPRIEDAGPSVISSWREKMSKGMMSSLAFKDHWQVWVAKFYKLEPFDNCLE